MDAIDIRNVFYIVATIALILFVGGIELLMLGVIGEYLSRVYDEVRQRPLYIVRSRSSAAGGADARQ